MKDALPRPPTPGSAGAEARPAASSAGSGSSAPRREAIGMSGIVPRARRTGFEPGRRPGTGTFEPTGRWRSSRRPSPQIRYARCSPRGRPRLRCRGCPLRLRGTPLGRAPRRARAPCAARRGAPAVRPARCSSRSSLILAAPAAFRRAGGSPIGARRAGERDAARCRPPPPQPLVDRDATGRSALQLAGQRRSASPRSATTAPGEDALRSTRSGARRTRASSARLPPDLRRRRRRHRYYQLGGGTGPSTGALDVGAAPGTDVYAPVDGTVVGLRRLRPRTARRTARVIDIQPSGEPSVVVSVTHLQADPALTVGSIGHREHARRSARVIDFSGVEQLALARYTQDAGQLRRRSRCTRPRRSPLR